MVVPGLTAVVVGILFYSPFSYHHYWLEWCQATLPQGINLRRVLMTSSLTRVKWDDLTESRTSVYYRRDDAIFFYHRRYRLGFIAHCVMKVGTPLRWKEINLCVVIRFNCYLF